MNTERMRSAYFEWMCRLVCDEAGRRGRSWKKLLWFLHDQEFVYILDMDGNRAADGIDLRYRFAYESRYDTHQVLDALGEEDPCSILEMMVALSIRCEEHIMDDPEFGNRTSAWFWGMVDNLGLGGMDDSNFDLYFAESVIDKFLRREYLSDGTGGLFRVEMPPQDMRRIDIWYQMMWYLDTMT